MRVLPTLKALLLLLGLFLGVAAPSRGAEYFVSPSGDDSRAGSSRDEAFRTIQRGVNALAPGDTLTIAPGEYLESVSRKGLGAPGSRTLIRAEIPGTAVLRGDVRAPEFRPVKGMERVSVGDFDKPVHSVNEVDTLKPLIPLPSVEDLSFNPGSYHQDTANGKLYISSSDLKPASEHVYTLSVISGNGLYLDKPVGVTVEGLAVCGFNTSQEVPYTPGNFTVWGILLFSPEDCVVRYCTAFLNGGGIVVSCRSEESNNNLIEYCTAYGNDSPFNDSGGNITIFSPKNSIIRHSLAYNTSDNGLRLYGQGMKGRNAIEDSLAWGNRVDLFIKGGGALGVARRSTAAGAGHIKNAENILVGMKNIYLDDEQWPKNSLHLEGRKVDSNAEFADPLNFDFRLQATSRFRGKGENGGDPGAQPYRANVFFVKPGGDDAADGLSLSQAWGSLARAVSELRAGDTLYLEPGVYEGDARLAAQGTQAAPIFIKGRGAKEAIIRGALDAKGSTRVVFERLVFEKPLNAGKSANVRFLVCRFGGSPVALDLRGSVGARVEHCAFAGFSEAGIQATGAERLHLSSNVFDNRAGSAFEAGDAAVAYSDYNVYSRGTAALAKEPHSAEIPLLGGRVSVPGFGALGKPAGPYRDEPRGGSVFMSKPRVHSVSATTANLEWIVTDDLICKLAWGETPECKNTVDLRVSQYGSFSLTGLKPGATYYFRIRGLSYPHRQSAPAGPAHCANPEFDVISFTTASEPALARTYYVAPDGDDARDGLTRATAWKSVTEAASRVAPGDTVLVAGGTYTERVRVRATGEKGAPITFRSLPGERVEFSSGGKQLEESWVITGKSHIRLDGFYFGQFRMVGGGQSSPRVLSLTESRDIEISRCFSDSRGPGTGAGFLTARGGRDVTVSNCVTISSFNTLGATGCENFRLEHSVVVVPMIQATMFSAATGPLVVEGNIFTCNSAYKKEIWLQEWKGNIADRNNAYFPRVPDGEKKLYWVLGFVENGKELGHTRMSLEEYRQRVRPTTDSLIADPQFAGLVGKTAKSGYPPDAVFSSGKKLDFADFYTTNPELKNRGIGLQPARFEGFHLQTDAATAKKQ